MALIDFSSSSITFDDASITWDMLSTPDASIDVNCTIARLSMAGLVATVAAGPPTPAVWAGPAASVNWTLTREQISDRAMRKCEALGIGETATAEERALCLESLDAILKNLQWRGYAWPKTVSEFTVLSLLPNVQAYALPTDAYDEISFYLVDSENQRRQLVPTTKAQWDDITKLSQPQDYPVWVYVDNYRIARFWPLPARAATVQLHYRKIILDTVAGSPVDLESPWMLGLVYGVAAEIGHEFGVDVGRIDRFQALWEKQIVLGIGNTAHRLPDRISIDC